MQDKGDTEQIQQDTRVIKQIQQDTGDTEQQIQQDTGDTD